MELRMLNLNKTVLVGRVTRDCELRFTPNNQAVTSFSIAVNRNYKDQQSGEWKEVTSFVQIVAWTKLAEVCAQRAKKGTPIFVEGRLQSRSWESKTGEKRSTLEVIAEKIQILSKSTTSDSNFNENNTQANVSQPEPVPVAVGTQESESITDEEIPF